MKKSLWVSAGIVALAVGLWLTVLSTVPMEPLTTGNVLKHDGTDVIAPANFRAVDAERPTLNFDWRHQTDVERPFHTDGEHVRPGAVAGDQLKSRGRYVFYFKSGTGELFVRRDSLMHLLFPFLHRRCNFADESQAHYPTSFDANESFDLGIGATEGNVVLAVTTRGNGPPTKRLYRIRIEDIEDKLP